MNKKKRQEIKSFPIHLGRLNISKRKDNKKKRNLPTQDKLSTILLFFFETSTLRKKRKVHFKSKLYTLFFFFSNSILKVNKIQKGEGVFFGVTVRIIEIE